MKIDHFAIWCDDIEIMHSFYTKYFECESNLKYHNQTKKYSSYFLSFKDSDCRIELMNRPDIAAPTTMRGFTTGIAHFDIEVGNESVVVALTERLRSEGYTIASEPRKTGDGYYEAAVLDPEGNYIEISAEYIF